MSLISPKASIQESILHRLRTFAFPHHRSIEHYSRVERARLPGESFLDAIRRIAVLDFLADCGDSQKEAARLLNVTPRVVNYYAREFGHRSYKPRNLAVTAKHKRGAL